MISSSNEIQETGYESSGMSIMSKKFQEMTEMLLYTPSIAPSLRRLFPRLQVRRAFSGSNNITGSMV